MLNFPKHLISNNGCNIIIVITESYYKFSETVHYNAFYLNTEETFYNSTRNGKTFIKSALSAKYKVELVFSSS